MDFHDVKSVVEYKAPIRFDWELDVGVRVARIGSSSVISNSAIFQKEQDDLLATGEIVWVNTDQRTHRPAPIPDETRRLITSRETNLAT